ncbi:MAG: SUMF1/EgtB/PvdO family nonheme iron enzyme [Anaerolineae bacterium]|nr:SUMF1/EgtB/PvdO family nonheme iron enzyme [Anaerolineae bacterium]
MSEPKQLGKYEILDEIGRGGFAAVYRARDTALDRVVALKLLAPHLTWEAGFAARFQNEAKTVARLRHPHIVTVHDIGEEGGQLYIAMECLEGETLADMLRGRGPLSLSQAIAILSQIADALDYAHRQGVLHRDVKPANIMVEAQQGRLHVTLMDFGLVKAMAGSQSLSSPGMTLGSPEYMAPEQADPNRKDEVGPVTDLYALGIVAYEMLTGRVPFPGNTPATLNAHLNLPPPDPRQIRAGLPERVTRVLIKALAKAPQDRYPTAAALVGALREAAQPPRPAPELARRALPPSWHEPEPAQRAPSPTAKPAWGRWALAGVLAVALLAGGIWIGSLIGPQPTPTAIVSLSTATPTATLTPGPTATLPPTPTTEHTPAPTVTYTLTSTPTGTLTMTPEPPKPTATPEKDGMEMVFVPAGTFWMGSAAGDEGAYDDEFPQHEVTLDAFWIDRTEVTNAQYRLCVQTGACQASDLAGDSDYNGDTQPVVGVDWSDAQAYCAWAGRSLPTEAQWEKAARGTDRRAYPWGNQTATCEYAVMDDGSGNGCGQGSKAWPVGSKPAGASPYGALDMAGNVWEWVADRYGEDYYAQSPREDPAGPENGALRVLRGGSWYDSRNIVRAAYRGRLGPSYSSDYVGFRCVRSGSGF